jgi:hypothetical protein
MSLTIEQMKDKLHELLLKAEELNREVYNISTDAYTIPNARAILDQLRIIRTQIFLMGMRLKDLAKIDSRYRQIEDTLIDVNGVDYEVVLFDEIDKLINNTDKMYKKKTADLDKKIKLLESFPPARIIPFNEDETLIEDELREFNEQIIQKSTCSICNSRVVNTRIDCGHLFCSNCIVNQTECPMCGRPIESFGKIYLKKYLKYRTKYIILKNKLHNKV